MKATVGYCSKYGTLSNFLCSKSPDNNDDWDELEDPCSNCGWRQHTEIEINDTFGCDTSKLVDNFRKYMKGE